MFAPFAFIQEDNVIRATLSSEGIIVQVSLSPYFSLDNGISRTNNKVDSWHNAFARVFGRNNPNIFKFLAALQRERSIVDVKKILYTCVQPNKILGLLTMKLNGN
ncbi:hypothetical protein HZS_5299 [Henneguya salminicola]|nr:hypothetical protein HZS_5299 [Henneguya salminicola]